MMGGGFFAPPGMVTGITITISESGGSVTTASPVEPGSPVAAGRPASTPKTTAAAPLLAGNATTQTVLASPRPVQNVLSQSAAPVAPPAASAPKQDPSIPVAAPSAGITTYEPRPTQNDPPNSIFTIVSSEIADAVAARQVTLMQETIAPAVETTAAVTEQFLIAEAGALARVANNAAARIHSENNLIWWETAALLGSVLLISYAANLRSPQKGNGEPL